MDKILFFVLVCLLNILTIWVISFVDKKADNKWKFKGTKREIVRIFLSSLCLIPIIALQIGVANFLGFNSSYWLKNWFVSFLLCVPFSIICDIVIFKIKKRNKQSPPKFELDLEETRLLRNLLFDDIEKIENSEYLNNVLGCYLPHRKTLLIRLEEFLRGDENAKI